MDRWSYKNIPGQEGKVAIVTGANSGLGYYTTKGLAEKGCKVIMACRNTEKGEEAKSSLLNTIPGADFHVMQLDLAQLASVRNFASEFESQYEKLALLINNAGLMAIPRRETADGFEMQFGVNHLGHFALTGLLFGLLKSTGGSRVVNVSSMAQSTEMGALPTLYAATAPEAAHRAYYGPRRMGGMRGYPERTYPNKKKLSKDVQQELWRLSESMTGVSFLGKMA